MEEGPRARRQGAAADQRWQPRPPHSRKHGVWAILDSGSSINGTEVERLVPNSKLRKSQAQRSGQTYTAANGGVMHNHGETDLITKTQEGQVDTYTFQNVKLDMPILSTARVADTGKKLLYDSDGGLILRPDGDTSKFIRHGDVYFQKIHVPKSLTLAKDVQGQGAAA